ncbi:MAG: Hpt domain-containing protein, partial [Desulfuromonadaceae bacterium]|nr:Hpt domain-containing protein [Desulfuromonadaceae bacterium]
MNTKTAVIAAKLKKIRESYIKQLPGQLETIRAAYSAFVLGEQGNAPLEDLHRRIHTMKGASASFRLGILSSIAMTGENLAKEALRAAEPLGTSWHQKMQEVFDRIEHAISSIDSLQGMELQIQELAIAVEETTERERKLVYLCEDDSYQ